MKVAFVKTSTRQDFTNFLPAFSPKICWRNSVGCKRKMSAYREKKTFKRKGCGDYNRRTNNFGRDLQMQVQVKLAWQLLPV